VRPTYRGDVVRIKNDMREHGWLPDSTLTVVEEETVLPGDNGAVITKVEKKVLDGCHRYLPLACYCVDFHVCLF